ncbi:MAG TPA: zinc-binding dehydrogenase, partial [Ktedonobacteraceae bacterium]|nr:zinc-binding dehydrogenase [Ktedonobacteraceae bacterium]
MWTSSMEISPGRVFITRALGRFWRGAYFSSFSPLQVRNVPRQQLPARNWVRVRNRLAGICGSDLHLIHADGDFRLALAALPAHKRLYPGHEVVGEVIEVGEDVTQVGVGDRVALQYGQNCVTTGTQPMCRSCAAGNYNLCEQGQFAGPVPVGGGWSEEMLLHEQQVFCVPGGLSDEQAVLLEPTAVAVHAVLRHLPKPDDHVLISGAGTIGLLVLQVMRALAPQTTISVMARYPFQVEQATRMGANFILYPQDTYNSVVRATGAKLYTGMLGNKMLLGGYDAIYDTIGTQRMLADALRWTRAGGSIVMVGFDLHFKYIDLTPVWYQEVNLIGSVNHGTENWPIGTRQRRSTFAVAADLMEQGMLHPEKLITHSFALTNFREALKAAANKAQTRTIKVIFDYALLPASVVPNVRSTARQRRPIRTTTTAWTDQEQEVQTGETDESDDTGHREAIGVPGGHSWSQNVQPISSMSFEPVDTPQDEFLADEINRVPSDETADEYVPPITPYITEEPETLAEPPLTEPAGEEETVSFYVYADTADTINRAPTEPSAPAVPEDESFEGTKQAQREPQPIIIGQEAHTEEPTEEPQEGEVETVVVRRPGSSRAKSAVRKTGGRTSATKD